MEAAKSNTILKIDKTNWKLVKFGSVVVEPKEICKDIVSEGIEHVVGLEHIDTGDLHLRKSATIEESTTFSKKFRKGDVLFGRRRAYLKKAAQANFDGICSGDITVFRVKNELSSALLPFIVNNDKFFDYAVKHSAGGLSPRVKFKDLANYEFLIPPKAEQARLAELLWAMDEVIEMEKKLVEDSTKMKKSLRKLLFEGESYEKKYNKIGNHESKWPFVKLGSYATIKGRIGWRGLKQSEYVQEGPYLIAGRHINEGKVNWEQCDMITNERYEESMEIAIKAGDVIFSKDGAIGNPAIIYDLPNKATLNSTMMLLRPKSNLDSEYLYQTLISVYFDRLKYRCLSGSAIPHIFQGDMKNFEFPLPPLKEQQRVGKILKQFDENIDIIKSKIYSSSALQKSLINQIF